MANLTTKYMGLELKNPIIVGANNMVTDTDKLKRMEKAGAAAVVFKSLFEEQIQLENLELSELKSEYEDRNAEMITLFPNAGSVSDYPAEHLLKLRKAKESVTIPVFASLNAINDEAWVEYAKKIEETGVDGLELNFYTAPDKAESGYGEIEKRQIKTLKEVRSAVKIPVSVKLSPFYTNTLQFIRILVKPEPMLLYCSTGFFSPILTSKQKNIISPTISATGRTTGSRCVLPDRFTGTQPPQSAQTPEFSAVMM